MLSIVIATDRGLVIEAVQVGAAAEGRALGKLVAAFLGIERCIGRVAEIQWQADTQADLPVTAPGCVQRL
ncbi:hypothetical protein D3C85_1790560 [compost metagenome]